MGVEVFHSLKKVLSGMSFSTAVETRRGFAPQLPSNEAALDVVMQAIEKAGLCPGHRSGDRHRRRLPSCIRTGSTSSRRATAVSAPGRDGGAIRQMGGTVSDRLDRGSAWPKMTGGAGSPLEALRRPDAAGGRRSVRHQRGPARPGIDQDIANASWSAQPDRTVTETPSASSWPGTAPRVVISTGRARPRHCFIAPISAVATRRARSRPALPAGPTGWPSTTSCCRIGRGAGERRHYPGKDMYRAVRLPRQSKAVRDPAAARDLRDPAWRVQQLGLSNPPAGAGG